jgi:hypothetical protein
MHQAHPPYPRRGQPEPTLLAESVSIGSASRWLKRRHLFGRVRNALLGVAVVVACALVLSWAIGGIGVAGLLVTGTLALLTAALLLRYPRLTVPPAAALAQGPLYLVIARTELWLETRCPALPPRAVRLVEHLGVQLDTLGLQVARGGEGLPGSGQIRWMVGEHLPQLVSDYGGAAGEDEPAGEGPAGEQAYDRIARVGMEIEHIARELAEGRFDDLPVLARRVDSLP